MDQKKERAASTGTGGSSLLDKLSKDAAAAGGPRRIGGRASTGSVAGGGSSLLDKLSKDAAAAGGPRRIAGRASTGSVASGSSSSVPAAGGSSLVDKLSKKGKAKAPSAEDGAGTKKKLVKRGTKKKKPEPGFIDPASILQDPKFGLHKPPVTSGPREPLHDRFPDAPTHEPEPTLSPSPPPTEEERAEEPEEAEVEAGAEEAEAEAEDEEDEEDEDEAVEGARGYLSKFAVRDHGDSGEETEAEDEAVKAVYATVRYSHYREKFLLSRDGLSYGGCPDSYSLKWRDIDEQYCISFVFKGNFGRELVGGVAGGEEEVRTVANGRVFLGVQPDGIYELLVTKDPTIEEGPSRAYKGSGDDTFDKIRKKMGDVGLGEDSASCSCQFGNPCAQPYNCKNWNQRFEIAKANGWKGHG